MKAEAQRVEAARLAAQQQIEMQKTEAARTAAAKSQAQNLFKERRAEAAVMEARNLKAQTIPADGKADGIETLTLIQPQGRELHSLEANATAKSNYAREASTALKEPPDQFQHSERAFGAATEYDTATVAKLERQFEKASGLKDLRNISTDPSGKKPKRSPLQLPAGFFKGFSKLGKFSSMLPAFGVFTTIMLVSAGATIYLCAKPKDDQVLYKTGMDQMKLGQYAFAVNSLTEASALNPKDGRIQLSLARAYIGIEQLDKAWESVSHAQQLGLSLADEPVLSTQLANYYRQRGDYEKAIDLMRPLAKGEADHKPGHREQARLSWRTSKHCMAIQLCSRASCRPHCAAGKK